MIDTPPPATPMPAQPVATVTSTEALPPPPAPLAHALAPAVPVTDPVSNLDFLPVDDAFALEFRSETIEQLVGGDALRRGVSERIEAGRSQTNADLVAGRDRVRVHATLHEHTGHGLAEVAAHLHTTVDGTLDVHAGSEDTVLLAGHMRELWDGGAAIVAAMTDDTVAGGGIRVTTPLDLWVHGLMGVEERIGTCTADAVLMESSATHYEREYGPGVHAAGLAVYTGSLYQSSRSSFRPLMRVSSGVRNLIAGGDGGGAGDGGRGGGRGGGGGDGSAGGAPAASPPPATAQTGAAAKSVTGTLAAGRRVTEVPATALDTTDALIDAQRVPLDALVDSVNARVGEEMGEAGTVMRAEDLPELSRSADTAARLESLQETLRMDATGAASGAASEAASGTAGGFRASEFDDAVSIHPATGGGGPLEIEPPSTVYGENAPMIRPHPGDAWGQGPEMKLRLLGGADRPPPTAAPESDFHAVYRRLRELRSHYRNSRDTDIADAYDAAILRVYGAVKRRFVKFGGNTGDLVQHSPHFSAADHAVCALQETARQAERGNDSVLAGTIRTALHAINQRAIEELQKMTTRYEPPAAWPTQAMQRPPATTVPTTSAAAILPPVPTPMRIDWITAYRQLRDIVRRRSDAGTEFTRLEIRHSVSAISRSVISRFRTFGGDLNDLPPRSTATTRSEQAYRAIEDMYRRAAESGEDVRAYNIRRALEAIHQLTTDKLDELTTKYGALDALSTQAMQPGPARVRPATIATPPVIDASTTVAPAGRLDIPGPEHRIVPEATHAFPEPAGGLIQAKGVPGPPPASSLPGASLSETGGAQAGDLGRWRLDPPAIGTTAAEPVATEAIVAPSLAEMSSFWLQPANPVLATGSVSFDSGLHHAGETVQPPPVTTAPSSTAPALSPGAPFLTPSWLQDDFDVHHAGETVQPPLFTAAPGSTAPALSPGAPFLTPSWLQDDFDVERALLAARFPPRFDASPFVIDASRHAELGLVELGLVEELAAGRLPLQTIDVLIDGYRATDEGGSSTLVIEYLGSLKESIERALRDEYPERTDPQWLNLVRELLRESDEPAPPSAASTAGQAEFDVMKEIDRLLEASESVSHPAPLPPPSTPGFTGAGAEAPPPAADPRGIRPPGMGGEPHPVAFDPWSAPPGRSSQVVYTQAIRTPVPSTGAPPGWRSTETPGFARAASGAVELPFSQREEIAHRFSTEDALLEAELALQTGGARALGWSATRWRRVRADLFRLNTILQSDSAAAAARIDVDWSAIEALARILEVPPPSP